MPSTIGRSQITLIHVAKARLGLTDDEYRAALFSVGVATSKDLTWPAYKDLMAHFQKCGFVPRVGADPRVRPEAAKPQDSKTRLLGKIYAQLVALDYPHTYADSMASRMFKIDRLEWCNAGELRKITAALTYHQRRRKGAVNA